MTNDGIESALLESRPEEINQNGRNGGLVARVWEENRKLWKVAFPSILLRMTMFGVYVVTQSAIGHIDEVDLAAYALVQSIIVRFVNGVLLGMSSATETMCGQAFGAQQYHMLGIYLQRSWIVNTITVTLFVPFFVFAAPIFKLLGEDESILEAVEIISLWFIPVGYSFIFAVTIQMYLQAQLKNMVIGYLSTVSFAVHVLLSWVFVYKLSWGVPGAMSAMNISRWGLVLGELIYVFGGWCQDSWKGFSMQAFKDLIPVVKLSVSSGFMLCLELWYTSILVLLAGYTSDAVVGISAFSICLSIYGWVLTLFLGFYGASCVRVANELGRGNSEAAKFSVKVNLCVSSTVGVLFWMLAILFGREIPYLFTNDDDVAEAAANLSVLLAFTILLNSLQTVLLGVAIGSGSQAKVAIVNLCSYYVIGIPLGALLANVADLGVKGIWIGMICGMAVQVLVLGYMTWRVDWNEEVKKTTKRLHGFLLEPSEE